MTNRAALLPDEQWNALAIQAVGALNYEAALAMMDKAIAIDPHPGYRTNRAHCLQKLWRLEEAETEIRLAIASDPKNPAPQFLLGMILLEARRPEEAVIIFDRLMLR